MTAHLRTVDPASLLHQPDAVRLLDVRTPAEFETGHVPGSRNLPLDLLRRHRAELARHLDDDVVLVCRSGARATQAGQALLETGRSARVLEGGVVAWESVGGPLTRGRRTWELERQVRLVAGGIVAAAVAGSTVAPRTKWLAGAIGTGLVVASLTDTCAMGAALARMPWNRGPGEVDVSEVLLALSGVGDARSSR